MIEGIVQLLQERGLMTDQELADALHVPRAVIRHHLAAEFFKSERIDGEVVYIGRITCNRKGQRYLGDPTPLILL